MTGRGWAQPPLSTQQTLCCRNLLRSGCDWPWMDSPLSQCHLTSPSPEPPAPPKRCVVRRGRDWHGWTAAYNAANAVCNLLLSVAGAWQRTFKTHSQTYSQTHHSLTCARPNYCAFHTTLQPVAHSQTVVHYLRYLIEMIAALFDAVSSIIDHEITGMMQSPRSYA